MTDTAAPIASSRSLAPRIAEMRATLTLAWPLILGNLAQMAINTTDVLILGRYDVDALAAAALAINLYWAFGIFGMGVVTAASPLIAVERGRRAHSVRDVRRTVRQACWVSVVLSLPIWALLWHGETMLRLLGQDNALAADAGRFIRIAMWGVLPFLLHLVLRYYVTALERPIWGLVVTASAVALNALACWALVFGRLGLPELGLEGAAIANAVGNLALFLGMVAVVIGVRRFRRYHLFGRFWRADWPRFFELLRVGVPIGLMLALEITIFNAAVFLMGLIGRDALAAHAIAIQVVALTFQIPFGIAQAATVRVGLFYGRGDCNGIARAGWTAFVIGLAFAVLSSVGIALGAKNVVAQFLGGSGASDPAVFRLAVDFLMVGAIFQLVDAMQAIGAGVLRGVQDTRWPMLMALVGYWVVGIGVAVLLAFYTTLAGVGIWIGLAAGLAVVGVLLSARWAARERLGLVGAA